MHNVWFTNEIEIRIVSKYFLRIMKLTADILLCIKRLTYMLIATYLNYGNPYLS